MAIQQRLCLFLCFSVSVVLMIGCFGGNGVTVPVSGTVTLDGNPLPDALITFMPIDGQRAATGLTDKDGRFSAVSAFSQNDGAIPGEHRIAITPKEAPPMPGGENTPEGIGGGGSRKYVAPFPARYGLPTESGLTATVERGAKNDFLFELTGK